MGIEGDVVSCLYEIVLLFGSLSSRIPLKQLSLSYRFLQTFIFFFSRAITTALTFGLETDVGLVVEYYLWSLMDFYYHFRFLEHSSRLWIFLLISYFVSMMSCVNVIMFSISLRLIKQLLEWQSITSRSWMVIHVSLPRIIHRHACLVPHEPAF